MLEADASPTDIEVQIEIVSGVALIVGAYEIVASSIETAIVKVASTIEIAEATIPVEVAAAAAPIDATEAAAPTEAVEAIAHAKTKQF